MLASPRLVLAAACLGWAARAAEPPTPAAARPAVIVNQAADGVVNFVLQKAGVGRGATRETALAAVDKLVDQYQGTGVSHIFWNVNYQRVGYDSAVWPSYWDVPDPEHNVTEWPRGYYELHKLGIDDVFARLIPRCRAQGLSPWISLRMNDHHYLKDPSRVSPLMFNHPELRTHGGWGLWNYARPEVRQHYLELVTEVLTRYDLDGLELDWIRTPMNFEDKELESGRAILSEFVRAVRRQTQAAAQRLGHPVRLAVRVPATPAFARAKGFEVVSWARDGLLDMIVASDWWSGYNDTPVEAWRTELGPAAAAVQLVPCTASTYACTAKGYQFGRHLAGMRGFAASMLDRGADGIYLFNHFDAVEGNLRMRTPAGAWVTEGKLADLLRAAGDLAGATTHPRAHALTIHDCVPTSYRPALPATLSTQPFTARLHVGPRPVTGRCLVRVGLEQAADLAGARLLVRVNGQDCAALDDLPPPAKPDPRPEQPRYHVCEVAPRVLQFEAPLAALTRGYNSVALAVAQGGPQTVSWLELTLVPEAAVGPH